MVTYSLLYIIKVLFAISIMVAFLPFVILDGCITIIILLISIPFSFKPIKYVFGFLVAFYNDIILV